MRNDLRHDAWWKFVRSVADVVIGRTKDDLYAFEALAKKENMKLVPLIKEYLHLMEITESEVVDVKKATKRASHQKMHLFDLLRDKTLFPHNLDLSRFAIRVVPGMETSRHSRISRSEIAARIIDHIEASDTRSRDALERAMRDALTALKDGHSDSTERNSFFSKWERIIKGVEI